MTQQRPLAYAGPTVRVAPPRHHARNGVVFGTVTLALFALIAAAVYWDPGTSSGRSNRPLPGAGLIGCSLFLLVVWMMIAGLGSAVLGLRQRRSPRLAWLGLALNLIAWGTIVVLLWQPWR